MTSRKTRSRDHSSCVFFPFAKAGLSAGFAWEKQPLVVSEWLSQTGGFWLIFRWILGFAPGLLTTVMLFFSWIWLIGVLFAASMLAKKSWTPPLRSLMNSTTLTKLHIKAWYYRHREVLASLAWAGSPANLIACQVNHAWGSEVTASLPCVVTSLRFWSRIMQLRHILTLQLSMLLLPASSGWVSAPMRRFQRWKKMLGTNVQSPTSDSATKTTNGPSNFKHSFRPFHKSLMWTLRPSHSFHSASFSFWFFFISLAKGSLCQKDYSSTVWPCKMMLLFSISNSPPPNRKKKW